MITSEEARSMSLEAKKKQAETFRNNNKDFIVDFEKKVKAVTDVGERSLSMSVALLTIFERKQFIEYLRLLNYTVHIDLFETSNDEKDTLFFWW